MDFNRIGRSLFVIIISYSTTHFLNNSVATLQTMTSFMSLEERKSNLLAPIHVAYDIVDLYDTCKLKMRDQM